MNKQNKTVIDTENKHVVVRGERVRAVNEIGEGD